MSFVLKILLLIFFLLFALGQSASTNILSGFIGKNILYVDIMVFISSFIFLIQRNIKRHKIGLVKYFILLIFPTIINIEYFKTGENIVGFLYFLRVFTYITFSVMISTFIRKKKEKGFIIKGLYLSFIYLMISGWLQYLIYPDMTILKYIGWDDHYYRIIGLLFDPNFLGLIFVFGLIMSVFLFISEKKNIFLYPAFLFLISILFTYSRSSYLALFAAVIVMLKKYKLVTSISLIFIFLLILPLMPSKGGEGVNLLRTRSIAARMRNYYDSINIIKSRPLFGLGFNNLCYERIKRNPNNSYLPMSNACFGMDSSLLLVISTTGIYGVIILFHYLIQILPYLKEDNAVYDYLIKPSLSALLINSFFINSIFYPWVMGYLAVIIGLYFSNKRKG